MHSATVENLTLTELPEKTGARGNAAPPAPALPFDIALIRHLDVCLTAQIGSAEISVARLFSLGVGDVVSLREQVNEPVTLRIGDKAVARGLLVAIDDHLGVEITEILPS